MKPETLERCIFWQRVVLTQSRDKAQQERCRRAIERLTEQLAQARQAAA